MKRWHVPRSQSQCIAVIAQLPLDVIGQNLQKLSLFLISSVPGASEVIWEELGEVILDTTVVLP